WIPLARQCAGTPEFDRTRRDPIGQWSTSESPFDATDRRGGLPTDSGVRQESRSASDARAGADGFTGDIQRRHILRVLERTGWVISGPRGAGAILEIHPNTLRSLMNRLGIRHGSNILVNSTEPATQ